MNSFVDLRRKQQGFTIVELMIVIVIVAVLLAVALPAFRNQVIRGHRAAAQSEMLEIANRQQQFLLANRAYTNDLSQLGGYSLPPEVDANYNASIALGAGTVPSYTLTFTATGDQTSDGNLTVNSEGVKTPADKWNR